MRPIAMVCLLAALCAPAAAAESTPEATIRALYAADKGSIAGKGQGVMGKPAALKRFLSRAVLKALDADAAAAAKRKEPPTIEGDPFTDEQEASTKDFTITPLATDAGKASVKVDLNRLDGAHEQLTYSLIFERGQWRIEDIAYDRGDGDHSTLRGLLNLK